MIYEQITLDMMENGLLGQNLNVGGVEHPLSLEEKIEQSIKAIRLAAQMSKSYYQKPLLLCYSGGKDSSVLLHLAESCLNNDEFEVQNSHTTVDAPETVYFIRKEFKRLNEKGIKAEITYARDKNGKHLTMWNIIPQKVAPPTRLLRYCCKILKETTTPNRLACLGVRAAESVNRQGRDIFVTRGKTKKEGLFFSLDHAEEVYKESQEINDSVYDCTLIAKMKSRGDTLVNPIYNWTDEDVWNYIAINKVTVNPLYEEGELRVGCILCPMKSYSTKLKEASKYPKYKQAYIKAFDRMLKERERRGLDNKWKSGKEVFEWWIESSKHEVKGQYNLFDEDIYG